MEAPPLPATLTSPGPAERGTGGGATRASVATSARNRSSISARGSRGQFRNKSIAHRQRRIASVRATRRECLQVLPRCRTCFSTSMWNVERAHGRAQNQNKISVKAYLFLLGRQSSCHGAPSLLRSPLLHRDEALSHER